MGSSRKSTADFLALFCSEFAEQKVPIISLIVFLFLSETCYYCNNTIIINVHWYKGTVSQTNKAVTPPVGTQKTRLPLKFTV